MTFIYGLIDPRTNELRYVGKTIDIADRMSRHIRKAKAGCVRHCRRWIAGLLESGLVPEIAVLEISLSHLASDAEKFWIASMRLAGCRLTNLTDGGDGQSIGYRASPESRLKQSIAEKARGGWSLAHRAAHAAALARPDVRAKMSASRKGITPARWIIDKASEAKRGVCRSRASMEPAWAANRARKKICSQPA